RRAARSRPRSRPAGAQPRTDRRDCPSAARSGRPSPSHRPLVALALPVADRLLPGLQLPRARHLVVVAELLAERTLQLPVRLERAQRALEGVRERREVTRGRVADEPPRRLQPATDAVCRR